MVDPAHLAYQKWKKAFSDQLSALNNGFCEKRGGGVRQLRGYRYEKSVASVIADGCWSQDILKDASAVALTVLTAAALAMPKSTCNLPLIITKGRIPSASGMGKTI